MKLTAIIRIFGLFVFMTMLDPGLQNVLDDTLVDRPKDPVVVWICLINSDRLKLGFYNWQLLHAVIFVMACIVVIEEVAADVAL